MWTEVENNDQKKPRPIEEWIILYLRHVLPYCVTLSMRDSRKHVIKTMIVLITQQLIENISVGGRQAYIKR